MPKADNKLNGARNLGLLGATPLGQGDKFKPKDIETLYRFGLDQSSSFNLSLTGLAKKTNADVELYRLKRPVSEVIGLMGNFDFRIVSGSVLSENVALVAASRRKKNKSESLALGSLDAGEYVVRVVGRSGKSSYSLQMGAVALAPGKPEEQTKKDTIAPSAILRAANFETEGSSTYDFTVTYNDDVAISVGSLDGNDVLVTGPNGFSQLARKVSHSGDGVASTATYQITAPVGTWSLAENGNYSVSLQGGQVSDRDGNYAPAASLGSFLMNTPLRSAKYSGTSNGPMASHFIFDFDAASGLLKRFGLTIYYDGTISSEVYNSVQLELFRNSPGGMTYEEVDDLKKLIPTTRVGQAMTQSLGVGGSASGGITSSQIIYIARLGNGSDSSGKPTTALILGIKTNNPDRSDPMALLKTALDGETPGAEIFGVYTNSSTADSFDFATTPSASLDRLSMLQILPDGSRAYDFQVTYSDNVAIDVSSIDNNDIEIGGQLAKKVAVSSDGNGTPITVTYRILGDSSVEASNQYGARTYLLKESKLRGNQVKDVNGNFIPTSVSDFNGISDAGRYGLYLPLK
jgi:large repetitive protein